MNKVKNLFLVYILSILSALFQILYKFQQLLDICVIHCDPIK